MKLTQRQINAIVALNKTFPNMKITGGISLNLFGVVNRDVEDIDIVVETQDFTKYTAEIIKNFDGVFASFGDSGLEFEQEDETKVNKNVCFKFISQVLHRNQLRLVKDGCNICVFGDSYNEDFEIMEIAGKPYVISHPKYAISAKMRYVDNLVNTKSDLTKSQQKYLIKHIKYINNYHKWLENKTKANF